MADTFTTTLSLTKPEVGASADTWGTKLNDNLDDIDALFSAGPVLKVANGGTAATTASGARTSLGLGSMATQDASAVAITGGSVSVGALGVSATYPHLNLTESDASTDNKTWLIYVENETFSIYAEDDGLTTGTAAIQIARTGTTVDSIALAATAVTINGNAAYHAGTTTIAETQITDGAVLARVGGNETVTGTWAFTAIPGKTGGGKFLHYASATYSGGAVTVSTADPSGTPGEGDRWVKYVA